MAKSILRDQPAKCAMRKVALIAQLRKVTRNMVPPSARAWLRRKLAGPPLVGSVKFGSLRRVRPISPHFGLSRGRPIDRYYIENFLADHSEDVHGRVLEIGWDKYTQESIGMRMRVDTPRRDDHCRPHTIRPHFQRCIRLRHCYSDATADLRCSCSHSNYLPDSEAGRSSAGHRPGDLSD